MNSLSMLEEDLSRRINDQLEFENTMRNLLKESMTYDEFMQNHSQRMQELNTAIEALNNSENEERLSKNQKAFDQMNALLTDM